MRQDTVSDVLSTLNNAGTVGKGECEVPASGLVKELLALIQDQGYIGEFEFVDDGKSGFFRVSLEGRINECGVIKPRFSVKKDGFTKWEKRYLPARGFGHLIVSTSEGILTNEEAQERGVGGILMGYIY